ncbi:MAG: DNA-binding response regulator [Alphaproteobacteria bacterium]|nr:MAG: DNA-binding response regulator [Alphaproteobacteria bacterium]
MDCKRVLIADDHPLFHEALKGVALGVFAPGSECVCTSTTRETMEALDQLPPFDLILLDLNLPGAEGFSCLIAIRSKVPSVPVMMVSSTDNEATVRESFSHGAMGYLPKSSSQEVMKNAIRLVMSGSNYIPTEALGGLGSMGGLGRMSPEPRGRLKAEIKDDSSRKSTLTPRQLAVLDLLGEGKANKIIAYELEISEITVKAHVSAILRKLGVSNRLQAVIAAKGLSG